MNELDVLEIVCWIVVGAGVPTIVWLLVRQWRLERRGK
jgi:hypothetical protein